MMLLRSKNQKSTNTLKNSLLKMKMDRGSNGCGLILRMAALSGVFHLLSSHVDASWFES
jgi:hypothetical protein